MSTNAAYPSAGPAAVEKPAMGAAAKGIGGAVLLSAIIIIIAAFLTWESGGGFEMDGMGNVSGEEPVLGKPQPGLLTMICAVPVALLSILRILPRRTGILQLLWPLFALLPTLAIIAVAFVRMGKADEAGNDPGIGMYLTLVFGIVALIAEIVALVKRK